MCFIGQYEQFYNVICIQASSKYFPVTLGKTKHAELGLDISLSQTNSNLTHKIKIKELTFSHQCSFSSSSD